MKIEAGKYYRTRGEQIVGPMRRRDGRIPFPWGDGTDCWTDNGRFSEDVNNCDMDLISEIYVSDTPPADAPAATPSDDTVVTFNFSQMARDGRKWATGSIGFWIGDEMRTAHYDVRIGGVEGKAWPSDVPNPWRNKRGLPAPAPETKTLRDEFAKAALIGLLAAGDHHAYNRDEAAAEAWRQADAMMEARKK